jgi:predicted methyltransferase
MEQIRMTTRLNDWSRATLLGLAALVAIACDPATALGADRYAMAVQHAGRSAGDLKRDAVDHPAELLKLTGIGPGMTVADVLAGDGYYSELLSYLVGARGHVLMINNAAFDKWSADGLGPRLANHRLGNVDHRQAELENMNLGTGTLDAALLVKVYHDMYWVDTGPDWPRVDTARVLDDIARAVKPGGVLLLVDHSAKPGTGNADAGRLHRIDENYARHDFESRGFRLVAHSDVLRRPDDQRDLISYKEPALGKTDRFVLVFRKQR